MFAGHSSLFYYIFSDPGEILFKISTPGPNVIQLFTSVIYECLLYDRVFVHGRPFQPNLMSVSKARAYPREAPFKCSTLG
jgi:hypothetical protein